MDKTNVKVEFLIMGRTLSPQYITEKLNLQPTNQDEKGKILRSGIVQDYWCWELSTPYEESFDINIQLGQIVSLLLERKSELYDIFKECSVDCRFEIVIIIENGETPAMFLDQDIIGFLSSLHASIEFDMYANPYTGL